MANPKYRMYILLWNKIKESGLEELELPDDTAATRKRVIQALKKEKHRDKNKRYLGELRFSYVGRTLIVRLD